MYQRNNRERERERERESLFANPKLALTENFSGNKKVLRDQRSPVALLKDVCTLLIIASLDQIVYRF